MKKLITLAAIALAAVTVASAQTWMDITSTSIPDPKFSRGNYDGWDYWGWANSTATRAGCQEFWNGMWDFSRTIEVPAPGRYRLSVQGYYRPGNFSTSGYQAHQNGSETIACELYANEDAVPMASIYSAYSETSLGDCWAYRAGQGQNRVTYYFPNSMETGAAMFRLGHYNNSLETTVGDDRELTIGIRLGWDDYQDGNWVLFTNWKLEWYGTDVAATAINLNHTTLTLTEGEEAQLTATVLPANTTFKTVTFSSSDASVASVTADGLVTAKSLGTAVITARMATGSSNVTATCRVTVQHNEVTAGSFSINEIQVSNIDLYLDPSFNFGGWVELYNPSSTSASLAGIVVSDNKGNTMTLDSRFGAVPAHGYKLVWFDHYSAWSPSMVNFKLDADGGSISFAKSDGTVVATQSYPAATPRTSYARTADNGQTWGTTDAPTPEATNAASPFATSRLEVPVVNHDGGVITTSSVSVRVTKPSGTTLRYTLDGTTPTLDNGETSADGRFTVSETTVLRLRLFQTGRLASEVVTRSFIFPDQNYQLPIVAITSDLSGLFGDDYGIFVRGNGNGRPGNGQDAKCNWNMAWDRPVNMEYITEDGKVVFNQEVTIESAGGWSRAWSPHSFNIKANKIYEGRNRMEYQFFDDKPYLRHKALKIRNGGNDTNNRIKDAAIQEVVATSGLNIETQAYKPVHVFFNGDYYATLNLREPNNRNYAYSHYGIDTDEQDQWKMSPDSGYVQQVGTKAAWDQLISTSAQAESPYFYRLVSEQLDIESYINYMAVMLYIGGTDWPQNNIKAFKAWDNGKFRFVVFDTDGAFSTTNSFNVFAGKQIYTFDALRGAEARYPYGTRLQAEIEFVTLFLNLLRNADFKKQFIDQFCIVAGSVFEPTRCREVIDALVERANLGLSLDWTSANGSANSVKSALSSSRQSTLVANMRSYLGLGTPVVAHLSSNVEGAALRINGLPVPTGKFSGRLFNPVKVTASAPAGYRFVGWATDGAATGTAVFGQGSEWSYYDQGSLDGQGWKAASYSTSGWGSGRAPLGYDTGNASKAAAYGTTISYGGNASSKHPTYYFRKSVNLTAEPSSADAFQLDWVADDGFVIYVNGEEAGRFLMNNTPNPTFSSFSDTYADANPESGSMTLPTRLFHRGSNIIAVELHNNSASSSDIYWDASLTHTRSTSSGANIISTEPTYTLPETGPVTLVANYEPLNATELARSDSRPIKINEVSAANDVYVNDLFKKNDWIELYNTTAAPIDVAGMFLSDKRDNPEKFVIPSSNGTFSTVVPAFGHLVVWADNLEPVSQLHAGFKLASEEGDVVITAADRSWADTLSYCGHSGLQSVGLYPDGGTAVYVMDRPTIGAQNVVTLADKAWKEPHYNIIDAIAATAGAEGPQLRWDGTAVTLQRADAAALGVFTASGQLLLTAEARAGQPVSLAALPQGIYIVRARTGDSSISIKIRK